MVADPSSKLNSAPVAELPYANRWILSDHEIWMLSALIPSLCDGSQDAFKIYEQWEANKPQAFRQHWPRLHIDDPILWIEQLLAAIEEGGITIHSQVRDKAALEIYAENESLAWLRAACFESVQRHVVSERSRLDHENKVRQQVYDLAYGLTHEINNPLANISARAQWMLSQVEDLSMQKSLATIIDQAQRGHEMLAELMLALQVPSPYPQPLDFLKQVRLASQRVEVACRDAGMHFQLDLPERSFELTMDADDLNEILWIASRNAWEACRAGDTLQWRISRSEAEVCLDIIDNGPGLADSTRERVWNFYFSGREAGRGLGLGLCKLHRIVQRNRGTVVVDSGINAGWRLSIRFPCDGHPLVR